MDHGSRRAKTACIAAVVVLFLLVSVAFGAETFRVSDYFSAQEIERGARYNRYLYLLFVLKALAIVFFLALVAGSRLARSYQRDVKKVCFGRHWAILPVYGFFLLLMLRLVKMPFDAVRTLVVKEAFGLNNQGIGGWLADEVKGFVVADLLYVPFVVLVFACLKRLRRTWWLVSAGALGLGLIVWHSLAPYVIHPLFYEITPVTSKAVRSRLDPLFEESGFPRKSLYQAQSGEKTNEANAYLAGLLLGRRIVLYDVLAERANLSEVEFVVAHEIAHWKYQHVMKGIALSTMSSAAVLLVIGLILRRSARRKRGMGEVRYEASMLPAFFLWLNVIALLSMPLDCAVSRRFERQADRYALELTRNPHAAVKAFQKVAKINIADIDPPPLATFWLYTHPPIPERMEAALRSAKTLGTSGGARKPEGAGHEADAKPEAVESAPGTDQPEDSGPEEQRKKDGEAD